MRAVAPLLIVLLLVMGGVSVWTPLTHDDIAERWFTLPNLYYFLPVPVLVLAFSVWLWRSVKKPESHARPFILTLGLIFWGSAGWASVFGRILFHRIFRCMPPPRKVKASCWLGR